MKWFKPSLDFSNSYLSQSLIRSIKKRISSLSEERFFEPSNPWLCNSIIAEQLGVCPKQFFLLHGAIPAIDLLMISWYKEEAKIILPPYLSFHVEQYFEADAFDVVCLNEQENNSILEDIKEAITEEVKMVFLPLQDCQGMMIDEPNKILEFIHQYPDIAFIIDETMASPYSFSFKQHIEKVSNLSIFGSFEKNGLDFLQQFFAITKHEIAPHVYMDGLQSPVTLMNFEGLMAYFSEEEKQVEQYVKLLKEKKKFESFLEKVGFKVWASNGLFVFFSVGNFADCLEKKLLAEDINVLKDQDLFQVYVKTSKSMKRLMKAIQQMMDSQEIYYFSDDYPLVEGQLEKLKELIKNREIPKIYVQNLSSQFEDFLLREELHCLFCRFVEKSEAQQLFDKCKKIVTNIKKPLTWKRWKINKICEG